MYYCLLSIAYWPLRNRPDFCLKHFNTELTIYEVVPGFFPFIFEASRSTMKPTDPYFLIKRPFYEIEFRYYHSRGSRFFILLCKH